MPIISIITVCYNAEGTIRQTIESVLSQSHNEYEYLIIDGKSSDSTVKIAENYIAAFKLNGIPYRIVSEKDNGIYNAMNKGTSLSSGEWLLFLNAGDELYKHDTIAQLHKGIEGSADVIYGKVIYRYHNLVKLIENRKLSDIRTGMVFCHQSTIIRRTVMEKYGYDERYQIAADYNFFIQCYLNNDTFKELDVPVSIFELGGASSDAIVHLQEEYLVQYNNGFLNKSEYSRLMNKMLVSTFLYTIRNGVMDLIPKSILTKLKVRKYMRSGYK